MSFIKIEGNQFNVSGQVRPYRMRTSFCLLAHYQRGQRDKAQRWLDRIQKQGFDGPRLFGENQDWNGGPFYGTEWTPRVQCFSDNAQISSQSKFIAGYYGIVAQLGQDLVSRGMVAEFCCVATIKGRSEPAWIGQTLNFFAQMFRQLYPDPKDTPFLHETVNEIDAHNPNIDKQEWTRMGSRWARFAQDAEHYNYPQSTRGVSCGGKWLPEFDDLSYTHRNTHPPRGEQWYRGADLGNGREEIGVTLDRLKQKVGDRPLAFNETCHYMTPAEWDFWVEGPGKAEKWRNLSTRDHDRLQKYTAEVLAHGVSFCGHDLIGQETNPDAPISLMEQAWAELFHGSVEPVKKLRYERIVRQAYKEILDREPEPGGLKDWNEYISRGGTEAQMREFFIRSDEYEDKNPE